MTEQEYIVTLKDPADWEQFHEQMIKDDPHAHIPDHCVVCTNDRPFSETQSHYMLTPEEAASISRDPRVAFVELNPDIDPNLILRPVGSEYAKFDKGSTFTADMKNWGLIRASSVANPFSGTQLITNFNYNLTGKGVDIVVIDTGIAENHPEFAVNADGTGGSRVVDFDWTTLGVAGVNALTGGSGTKGFLGDCEGHGSNCASVAAGNTCGWARDASIYSIRTIPSSTGSNTDIVSGATLGLISISLVFDLVKAFHLAKPILSNGYRRPTICSNSWAFVSQYASMTQTYWRGGTYATSSPNTNYGQVSAAGTYHGSRSYSTETAMGQAMAAGVIMLGAAGNYYHKIDVPGGTDYNNYWTNGSNNFYYHRGCTPGSANVTVSGQTYHCITVGAIDYTTTERKTTWSETGPRVDLYAPGRYIAGAGSSNYTLNAVDTRNASGVYKFSKISGTSQATPQVAGVLACVAQARPWMNQISARDWLLSNCLTNVLDQNAAGGTAYTNQYYLQGGPNRILHMPYNSSESIRIQGNPTITANMRIA